MTTTSIEKLVVYRLGYPQNPPPIQSLPPEADVANLFLLNLAPSDEILSINDDANYQTADAIIETLSSQAGAAAAG